MRPGILGGLGWLLAIALLYATSFGWLTARKFREAWREIALESGELDESLACDLVADFVVQNESGRKVRKCEGELVVIGAAARLSGVTVDWEDRSYCLARAPGWRALRVTQGVPCFPTPPPDVDRVLESEQQRVAAWTRSTLQARLAAIRMAMTSKVRPSKCAQGMRARRSDIPLLEFELLQGGDTSLSWPLLSTAWLRDAVLKDDAGALLKAADRWAMGRPWVAVITSASRESALGGPAFYKPFRRGSLTGTMTVIDAEVGELLCEVPFAFESSATLAPLPGRLLGLARFDAPTNERVQTDFQERFKAAALKTLNEMTGYQAWPALE